MILNLRWQTYFFPFHTDTDNPCTFLKSTNSNNCPQKSLFYVDHRD